MQATDCQRFIFLQPITSKDNLLSVKNESRNGGLKISRFETSLVRDKFEFEALKLIYVGHFKPVFWLRVAEKGIALTPRT